jgi:hypothetical protein
LEAASLRNWSGLIALTDADTTDSAVGAGAAWPAAGAAASVAASFLHAPSAHVIATASASGAKTATQIHCIADIVLLPL